MTTAAGSVNINLSMNAVTFTQGIKNAQAELDKFAGKAKSTSHATVSSMQASSAAIRELNGDFTRNTRAVERFITTIPGVGKALQVAFPLVGGIAFASMIVDAGEKVAAFIDKANKMPAAIRQGFESLHLSAMSSSDALKLTDDLLQNHINKLQGKSQNNLAIQLDEARIKADELAKSLEEDATRVKSLLQENQIGALAGLLTGKAGTSGVAGTINYGLQEIQHLAYLSRQAVGTPAEAQAQKNLSDKQTYYRNWAANQLFMRDNPQYATDQYQDMAGDQGANRNALVGFQDVLNDQLSTQAERARNAKLVPQNQAAEASHAAAEKAAEARRKAAEEMRQSWEADLAVFKQWQEYARSIAAYAAEYANEQFKTSGLSPADSKSLNEQGSAAKDYVQSLRESIELNQKNSTAIAEFSIQMAIATGQMSRLDGNRAVASLHSQDFADSLQKLKDQREAISASPEYDEKPLARKAAVQDNSNRVDALTVNRQIQVAQDNQNASPSGTSGIVGATDALNDFVVASRDAAAQMRDFTQSTIQGFNTVLLQALTTRSTGMQNHMAFANYGAGLFRGAAGMGLNHLEGSALSMFGFGSSAKLGTQSNPMWTRSADAVGGAISSVGGFFSKMFGGGAKGPGASGLSSALKSSSDANGDGIGTIASSLTGMIPFLASGGPISGPAIVGEQGPELFNPGTSGTIIPNHKLSIGGSTGHVINIDATGSTDPAQTQAAVMRGIASAAPHIMAGSVHAFSEHRRRRPSSAG